MVNSFLLKLWDYECKNIVISCAVGCQLDSSIPGTYGHALNLCVSQNIIFLKCINLLKCVVG